MMGKQSSFTTIGGIGSEYDLHFVLVTICMGLHFVWLQSVLVTICMGLQFVLTTVCIGLQFVLTTLVLGYICVDYNLSGATFVLTTTCMGSHLHWITICVACHCIEVGLGQGYLAGFHCTSQLDRWCIGSASM